MQIKHDLIEIHCKIFFSQTALPSYTLLEWFLGGPLSRLCKACVMEERVGSIVTCTRPHKVHDIKNTSPRTSIERINKLHSTCR
jgi:hypothetical protein